MNCILYARVSTDKQADKDLSIPAQLQAMRDYARQHDWSIVEEFLEPGASAKTTDRPALQKLLSLLREAESKIDVVLVHKIDRLARNVYDHATIKALLKQRNVRLASVVENMDDSVSGQLVENIMASIAQFYSSNLGEEVRKGMRQKVLIGGWPHLAPRGYISVRSAESGVARVEIHPKDGPVMQQAFELYATGWYSLKALSAKLAHEGLAARNGQPMSHQYLRRLLSNPFYLGRVRWKELELAGAHAPLTTVKMFDQVQEVMRRRFKDPGAKGSVNGFPLRGLAICATCRGHMTAGWQRKRWGYYRCSRRGYNRALCSAAKYSSATAVHRAVEELCWKLRLSSTIVDAILKEARRVVQARTANSNQRVNSLRMQRSKLVEREMRLTEGFVSGDIPSNAYKTTGTKLKEELGRVETECSRLQRSPNEILTAVEEMLSRAATIWELHEQLNETRRIELLRSVFQTVVLNETGMVGFTLRPPFDAIFTDGGGGVDRELSRVESHAKSIAHKILESVEDRSDNTHRHGKAA